MIFAFGLTVNQYYIDRGPLSHARGISQNLLSAITQQGPLQKVSLGAHGAWFYKNFLGGYCVSSQTSISYPQVKRIYDSDEPIDWVVFGNNGAYFLRTPKQTYASDTNMIRTDNCEGVKHQVPVLCASFGYQGAWVAVDVDGRIRHHGLNGEIVTLLKKGAIRDVHLCPFSRNEYLIEYTDGTVNWHLPWEWRAIVNRIMKAPMKQSLVESDELRSFRLPFPVAETRPVSAIDTVISTSSPQQSPVQESPSMDDVMRSGLSPPVSPPSLPPIVIDPLMPDLPLPDAPEPTSQIPDISLPDLFAVPAHTVYLAVQAAGGIGEEVQKWKEEGSNNRLTDEDLVLLLSQHWGIMVGSDFYHLNMPKNGSKPMLDVSPFAEQSIIAKIPLWKVDILPVEGVKIALGLLKVLGNYDDTKQIPIMKGDSTVQNWDRYEGDIYQKSPFPILLTHQWGAANKHDYRYFAAAFFDQLFHYCQPESFVTRVLVMRIVEEWSSLRPKMDKVRALILLSGLFSDPPISGDGPNTVPAESASSSGESYAFDDPLALVLMHFFSDRMHDKDATEE